MSKPKQKRRKPAAPECRECAEPFRYCGQNPCVVERPKPKPKRNQYWRGMEREAHKYEQALKPPLAQFEAWAKSRKVEQLSDMTMFEISPLGKPIRVKVTVEEI